VFIEALAQLAAACPRTPSATVEIERRRRRWNDVVVLDGAALAIEPGGLRSITVRLRVWLLTRVLPVGVLARDGARDVAAVVRLAPWPP
jgi:hypothetical protein